MRWKSISLIALIVGLLLCLWLWRDDSQKRILADGTELRFSRLRIGRTNVYTEGSLLSRTLGLFASRKTVAIAGLKVKPPSRRAFTGIQGSEILTAQLRVKAG